ncbi:MAG: hypothetical protein LUD02_05540 [Tannerellaceae bacterium]|nr:hypothetical protein [Tannerellaceae bacterium]MCD8263675.1 hypothetical protein [Tannerellaceae bacterium]
MALKYHLVRRLDMRKDAVEGSTLLYGQVRANERVKLRSLCELLSGYTSATAGDVLCVIKGLIFHMKQHLANGNTIHLGEFGSFRVSVGSSGVEDPKDFHPSMFRKPRIIFTPGTMLQDTPEQLSFKKIEVKKCLKIVTGRIRFKD